MRSERARWRWQSAACTANRGREGRAHSPTVASCYDLRRRWRRRLSLTARPPAAPVCLSQWLKDCGKKRLARWARPKYPTPTLKGTAAETDQKRPSHFLLSPTPSHLMHAKWTTMAREGGCSAVQRSATTPLLRALANRTRTCGEGQIRFRESDVKQCRVLSKPSSVTSSELGWLVMNVLWRS